MLSLREKSRALESRLTELLQIGEENDAIGEKMHRLSLALLSAPDLQSLLSALYLHLHEDFAVPHSALRIWGAGGEVFRDAGDAAEFRPVGEQLKRYAASLSQPFCGPKRKPEPRPGSARGLARSLGGSHGLARQRSASECLRSAAKTCCVLSRDGHAVSEAHGRARGRSPAEISSSRGRREWRRLPPQAARRVSSISSRTSGG